jgi:hypothetical protein
MSAESAFWKIHAIAECNTGRVRVGVLLGDPGFPACAEFTAGRQWGWVSWKTFSREAISNVAPQARDRETAAVKYEKPQKGNRHCLTIRQHVFPTRSIERFADADGKVSVRLLRLNKLKRVSPGNTLFCARRAWDQRAEIGYMKGIEDEFQSIAGRIVDGCRSLTSREHASISRFFALWYLRASRRTQPEPDQPLRGIIGEHFTKDEEEILEKHWISFARRDATVPGRMMLGLKIQIEIDRLMIRYFNEKQWGILQASNGNFLVPDISHSGAVPVSPNLLLLCERKNTVITQSEIAIINFQLASFALEYLIARDFQKCYMVAM